MPKSAMSIWIIASRPKTLWAAIAPVIMGTAMAYGDGALHITSAIMATLGAVAIQIGTNFGNDYYDFKKGIDQPGRLGPTRATQAGLVKPEVMKRATVIAFATALIIGIYLVGRGGWPIVVIGLSSILFGMLYTAGPYPLGYNGLGDIFVLIFFGPVAVGGTYYVQTLTINPIVLWVGIAPGLFSTAILTVNNLRDATSDRQAGKKTLAIRFGITFTRWEYALCITLACLIPFFISLSGNGHSFASMAVLVLPLSFPAIKQVFKLQDSTELNKTLAQTGQILLLYSLIFSAGWLL